MANSENMKTNTSSLQVLKTFMLLLENDYTMSELVDKLNEKERKAVFNNSVVSKYINTCRYIGIDIPKIQNKYCMAKLPFGLELTSDDLDLILNMQETAKIKFSENNNKKLADFLERLQKYSNKEIIRVKVGSEDEVRKRFDTAVNECRKIKLMYRSGEVMECNPLEIIYLKGKIYLKVFFEGKEKNVAYERITGLEVSDKKFISLQAYNEVIFRLTGNLAKRYTLRENEIISDRGADYIVVVNNCESKLNLYSRLLRYDSLCEILEPKICREDMIKIINDTLANYGD